MQIEIKPEQDDDGKTVFAWFVMRGDETLGGGYGATEADARNDAESFMAESGGATGRCSGASGSALFSDAITLARLRQRQADAVGALIGGLLDAWDQLPTDLRTDPDLRQLAHHIDRIRCAMDEPNIP